jgi:hypothetical protein
MLVVIPAAACAFWATVWATHGTARSGRAAPGSPSSSSPAPMSSGTTSEPSCAMHLASMPTRSSVASVRPGPPTSHDQAEDLTRKFTVAASANSRSLQALREQGLTATHRLK